MPYAKLYCGLMKKNAITVKWNFRQIENVIEKFSETEPRSYMFMTFHKKLFYSILP